MTTTRTVDAGALHGARVEPSPPPSPGTAPRRSRPGLVVLGGTVALVVFQLWVTRHIDGPSMYPDEAGYLGNARWLAGDDEVWQMGVWPSYGFGYSLVLAPLFRLIGDPGTLWQAVLTTNALLMASVFPLLYGFGRKVLGADAAHAAWAAGVGALVPATVAHSTFGWSENLSLPLCVAAVLAAWALLTPRPTWSRLLFGPAVALLFATHGRFTLVVPVALVLLAVAATTDLAPRRLVVTNATVLVVLVALATVVKEALIDSRYVEASSPEGSPSDLLDIALDPSRWSSLVAEAAGQAWYIAAGSLLLAVLGLWALTGRVVGARRRLRTDPAALTVAFLLAAVLVVFVTSTFFFTKNQWRSDHFIYGRHNDAFVTMLVAAGVVLLLTERRRVALTALLGGSAAFTAAAAGVVLLIRDRDRFSGPYGTSSIPAVAWLIGDTPRRLLPYATAAAVAAGLVLALAAVLLRRPRLALPLAAAWFVAAGLWLVDGVDRYENTFNRGWQVPDQVDRLDVDRLAIDITPENELGLLTYQYWLDDVTVEPFRSERGEQPGEPLVLASLASVPLREGGARLVLADARTDLALWAMPGATQRRLEDEGRLLPADFPSALPATARRAELSVTGTGEDGVVGLRPGATVRLTVRGQHTGGGSPWPNFATFGRPGLVRIGARLTAVDAAPGSPPLQEYRAELPRWVEPGDRFTTELDLAAVGADGRPLSPGRYEVGIDLVQDGFEWFAEPGEERVRLRLDVEGTR